jgi:Tripartite tricarboxylate transporter TctB family
MQVGAPAPCRNFGRSAVRRADIISGLALIAIGLVTIFYIIPTEIAVSQNYGLNPKVFPLAVMWLGTAVALLLVVLRLREPRDPDEEQGPMQAKNWLFIAAISGFFAASYFAIETFGFLIAAPVMVALLMAAMGESRHPVRLVLVSALFPTAIYFAFDRLFIIQLP